MTSRPTILIVSNIAWDFVWQRHQTIATLWARDHEVVFLELPGIRRVGWRDLGRVLRRAAQLSRGVISGAAVPSDVRVLRPWILPATNRFFCAVNRRTLRRLVARVAVLHREVDVLWTYSASRTALDLVHLVSHRCLIYDCTDDWLAVKGVPSFLEQDEKHLLIRADLTLVPSRVLAERKRSHARRLERLPHGAWIERFQVAPRPHPKEEEPLSLLYYGHLHRQHLDVEALEKLARARPAWRIVLLGPVKTPYAFPSNVELPGAFPHDRLRDFIERADVLLLPYRLNHYTEAVMPAKTYECLATGRPVVATPLPELVAEIGDWFDFVAPGGDWAREIERAVAKDSVALRNERIAMAHANSWDERFRKIRALIEA